MNGKEILDVASNIIKRQDLDRALLLFFVNSTRKAILRDKQLRKLFTYIEDITMVNGKVDLTPYNLFYIKTVEWQVTDAVTGEEKKVRLEKLISYNDAIDIYHSLEKVGSPKHYLVLGNYLHILAIPVEGSINIYGEVFPANLEDTLYSSDILSHEIGEALVYLGAAEYFDMLGENNSGQFWRQKGMYIVDQYVKNLKLQDSEDINLMARDPFGGTPTGKNKTQVVFDTVVVDDLDAGGF